MKRSVENTTERFKDDRKASTKYSFRTGIHYHLSINVVLRRKDQFTNSSSPNISFALAGLKIDWPGNCMYLALNSLSSPARHLAL